MNRTLTLILTATAVTLANAAALAAPIYQPAGLGPGDAYRLVFVTSTSRDATSTDIASYNSFVTSVANSVPELAALGTTWSAVGSTSTVNARDNTQTNTSINGSGVPIYRLDGTLVANDYGDLWDGGIQAAISTTELGDNVSGRVWTGTTSLGIAHSSAPLGGVLDVVYGNPQSAAGGWRTTTRDAPTFEYRFYAMSGVLTAVPEPASLVSMSIFSLAVLGWRYVKQST